MTILPKNFRRAVTVMAMAAVTLLSGCHKGMKDDIKELDNRVTALEELTRALDAQLKAGALLSSATPLAGNSGWTLTFSNGTVVTVENGPGGGNAVTPKIEIRPIEGGGYSLWYNVTEGYPASGWVDTETNIQGPVGPIGPKGNNGGDGGSGEGGYLDLRTKNGYIQYTTVENPAETDWQNLFQVPSDGRNGTDGVSDASITFLYNDNGTVTIGIGEGAEAKSYTFELYHELPQGLVVVVAEKSWDPENSWFKVTFRVNPSTADVSGAEWILDEVRAYTRADNYVPNPSEVLEITDVVPSQAGTVGEYVATLTPTEDFSTDTNYVLALVLEVNEALISSGSFNINNDLQVAEPVWVTGIKITVDDGTEVRDAEADLMMEIGDVVNLAAVLTPANPDDTDVTWTVDPVQPNDFVEFDDETGVLTALSAGEVIITVTSSFTDGDDLTAELHVIVAPTYAESVAITLEGAEVADGAVIDLELADESITFGAVVGPEAASVKDVTWTSSDDTVATVDPDTGVVTITGGGAVTITATAVGVASEAEAVEDSVDLFITAYVAGVAIANADAPEAPITSLAIPALGEDEAVSLVPIFSTILPGVEPNVEDIEVTWAVESTPSGAVTIDENGVITPNMVGEAIVTVTATGTADGEPETAEIAITVTSPVTELIVYPGEVTFQVFGDPAPTPVQLEVDILPARATDPGNVPPAITWESNNPELVSVSATGLITLLGNTEEEVIITATNTATGISGSCTVYVVHDLSSVVIDDDDLNNILDNWVLKSPDDVDGIDPNNIAQLWNVTGGTQQPFYNIGDAAEFPTDPYGQITIEQELEAAYGGGVDFDVTYEFVAQARWQQTGSTKNWFVDSVPVGVTNASVSETGTISPVGTTIVDGHNIFGDRLVIKVTITEAADEPLSGVTLTPNPMVTYICVRLP